MEIADPVGLVQSRSLIDGNGDANAFGAWNR
jgi:hypothetical protein